MTSSSLVWAGGWLKPTFSSRCSQGICRDFPRPQPSVTILKTKEMSMILWNPLPSTFSSHSVLQALPHSSSRTLSPTWSMLYSQKTVAHLFLCAVLCLVTQSCPTLWDPMDCSPPGSSLHGDSPGMGCLLEWVVKPSSREFSQPRDWTEVSGLAGRFFTVWATREAQGYWNG